MATIPSGVQLDAAAAITPMTASGTVLIADLPRRYTATAKMAMTTGPVRKERRAQSA